MNEHVFSKYIEIEIDFCINGRLDDDGEPMYNRAEAIKEIENVMEYNNDPSERKYLKELRKYLASVGVYEVITPERLQRIQVSSGKKYDFKIEGVMYAFKSWKPLLDTKHPQ